MEGFRSHGVVSFWPASAGYPVAGAIRQSGLEGELGRARFMKGHLGRPYATMKDGPRPEIFALRAQAQQGASNSMAISATQLRPGMIIKHNDQLHLVFKVQHRTPGNLRAFIQAKLRNLKSGGMFEHRFRSADAIEKVIVDEISMDFLYADGDDYYFMNPVLCHSLHTRSLKMRNCIVFPGTAWYW